MRAQLLQLGYRVPQRDYSFKEPGKHPVQKPEADSGRQPNTHDGKRFSSSSTAGKHLILAVLGVANLAQ